MKRDPLRAAFERDPGCLKHAVRILAWWADDHGDDPDVLEAIKQSREVARSLARLQRAARRKRAA